MRTHEYDVEFRDRATRIRNIGIGLLFVAGLLWAWCAVLLLTSYEADREFDTLSPAQCGSRLYTKGSTANEGKGNENYCQRERDWPKLLAVLGLSVPVSVIGVALFTGGSVSHRMGSHSEAIHELYKLTRTPKK